MPSRPQSRIYFSITRNPLSTATTASLHARARIRCRRSRNRHKASHSSPFIRPSGAPSTREPLQKMYYCYYQPTAFAHLHCICEAWIFLVRNNIYHSYQIYILIYTHHISYTCRFMYADLCTIMYTFPQNYRRLLKNSYSWLRFCHRPPTSC